MYTRIIFAFQIDALVVFIHILRNSILFVLRLKFFRSLLFKNLGWSKEVLFFVWHFSKSSLIFLSLFFLLFTWITLLGNIALSRQALRSFLSSIHKLDILRISVIFYILRSQGCHPALSCVKFEFSLTSRLTAIITVLIYHHELFLIYLFGVLECRFYIFIQIIDKLNFWTSRSPWLKQQQTCRIFCLVMPHFLIQSLLFWEF